MANGAIVTANIADDGTLMASGEVDGMEIDKLIDSPHVRDDLWRATGSSANFTWDYGGDTSLDTVALFGLTMGAAGTLRCRVSSQAGGSTAGDRLDTGTLSFGSAWWDYRYGAFVYPLGAAVSARYVRFDLDDAEASFIEAGRLVIGTRTVLDYNFAPGSSFDWLDENPVVKSSGRQTLTWERAHRNRAVSLDLSWVSNSQRWGLVETLGRDVGRTGDVLMLLDPAASNLPQWTVWGLIVESAPSAFLPVFDAGGGNMFSKQIRIEERL